MSFGIAFAGGGTKGAAHVGVLLALEKNNMMPSSIAGTSAGSIIAGLYSIGFTPYKLREMVYTLSKKGLRLMDPDYFGIIKTVKQFVMLKPVQLTGLIKGDKLEEYLCKLTNGKTMRDANLRTVIPTIDINSGKTIVYTNSLHGLKHIKHVQWEADVQLCHAMRASCAIPAVFQPKIINNMCLVDGGVTDVLPVDLLIATGEKNILAIDLSDDYKEPDNNNIIEVATHSLSIMRNRLQQHITSGEKLLLKPTLPNSAGLLSFESMIECMEAGYDATIKMMPTIKALFE